MILFLDTQPVLNCSLQALFLTTSDVDASGKSYYGETNLYLINLNGQYECKVAVEKEGPIHDFAWNPNSREFAVTYGYVPARTTLFDAKANELHSFGTEARNYLKYQPQGRLLLSAGFGNLNGNVDIWDLRSRKKVAEFVASNSTVCEWSPCGRFILTGILSPRLRVDNGVKIWWCAGKLLHVQLMDELYQVSKEAGVPVAFSYSHLSRRLPGAPTLQISRSRLSCRLHRSHLPVLQNSDRKHQPLQPSLLVLTDHLEHEEPPLLISSRGRRKVLRLPRPPLPRDTFPVSARRKPGPFLVQLPRRLTGLLLRQMASRTRRRRVLQLAAMQTPLQAVCLQLPYKRSLLLSLRKPSMMPRLKHCRRRSGTSTKR